MFSSRAYTKSNWSVFWEWTSLKYFMYIYNTKYHKVDTFICENSTHLILFNSDSSIQDVSKIVGQYTDE